MAEQGDGKGREEAGVSRQGRYLPVCRGEGVGRKCRLNVDLSSSDKGFLGLFPLTTGSTNIGSTTEPSVSDALETLKLITICSSVARVEIGCLKLSKYSVSCSSVNNAIQRY